MNSPSKLEGVAQRAGGVCQHGDAGHRAGGTHSSALTYGEEWLHNSFEQIIINFIKARKMKKIGLILTLLFTIFAPQEVLAATATQDLQVGHYYRIRSSVTTDMVGGVVQKHYMCLVYDNAASQYEVKILRQSDIVSAPGSIFKITGLTSSKINLETQEQDVWSSIKGSSLIDEHGRNWIWTADLLGINKPIKYAAAENSDGFHLSAAVRGLNSVGFATKAYFQDETLIYRNSNEDYHEPLGMSAEPSTIWYFEEVNEANIDDTYLGLPCAVSKESVTVSDMVTNTVDGVTYYYSTMRAPFPLQFVTKRNGANEQSKLTPGDLFFVKSDRSLVNIEFNPSGTMSKTYVIPANTPFVIRTTTNNPADYKFQPSLGSGNVTNTNDNALQSASTYFVRNANKNVVSDKCMLSIVDGEAKFHNRVGSEIKLSYYDGNRAYFTDDSYPIPTIEKKTLSELIHGNYDSGTQYILSNDLYVGYVTDGKVVYAHDAGVEGAKYGAITGGGMAIVFNLGAILKGKSIDEAVKDVAVKSAKSAVRSYAVASGATLIDGGIKHYKNELPKLLKNAKAPTEIAGFVVDAASAFYNYYNGSISGVDCMKQLAVSASLALANLTPIGQAVFVARTVYTLASVSVTVIRDALKAPKIARERRIQIEKECQEQIMALKLFREEYEARTKAWLKEKTETFVMAFDTMDKALQIGDVDSYICGANQITHAMGCETQFENCEQFKDLMNSDEAFIF